MLKVGESRNDVAVAAWRSVHMMWATVTGALCWN